MMRTFLLTVVLVLLAAAPLPGDDTVKPRETTESSTNGYVGKRVASFQGTALSGAVLYSKHHDARALIISFWGLNCGSCLDEMRALQPVYEELAGKGLKIWAVNTEDIGADEIRQGLRSRGMKVTFDIVPDPGLAITKNFTSWFIPVTVIVDSDGIVQYYKIGFNAADVDKIKAKVGALLAR